MDDPVITEYVNRAGQNSLLNSDEVNAFALPGGFFYVGKTCVPAADSDGP